MAILPGKRLGPYEILSSIGAGGMGEVYRAKDTRLDRIVAIKVLPPHLADSPELRERLEREARTIASLSHPHISTLYDIGHQDGTDFLVMEYLEGETLAQRLVKGPLPLDQVLQYATEIADALDKAHRKGVTHRDLKPGNIMLTKSGTKLLDFGLAKLKREVAPANVQLSQLPTANDPLTAQGTIVGTLQYMAPEQLEGREVDPRTDIFAFGTVVYEMATGKKAFEGKSQASVISAIMSSEPPAMSSLQPMTPPALDRVAKRCLAKEPDERWQSANDLANELKWIAEGGSQAGVPVVTAVSTPHLTLRFALISGLACFIVAVVVGLTVWNLKPTPALPAMPVTRTVITLPQGDRLAAFDYPAIALSPDGTQLAYVAIRGGRRQIFLRRLDGLDARLLADTEGANSPFFSPDGQWVGFFAGGKLKKISVSRGAALTLADASSPRGATWTASGTIIFSPNTSSALQQVSDGGSTPQPLTHLDKGEIAHRYPELLPNDKVLFAVIGADTRQVVDLTVQSLATGERRNISAGGISPRYATSGHLIYAQGANLTAVPFDPQRLQVTGTAVPMEEGVLQVIADRASQFSISANGSLAYIPGGAELLAERLVWVNRNGTEQPLAVAPHTYVAPRLSPDGQRIAVTVAEQGSQIWLCEIAQGALTRLTFEGTTNQPPVWMPDGKRIAFYSNKEPAQNLAWQRADGSGGLERLPTSTYTHVPNSFSRDGQLLAFAEINPATGFDILILTLSDHQTKPFLRTPFNEAMPTFSPDGRWMAYISDESGRYEVYIQPYPGPGGKWQISTEGGTEPVWNRNGRELFYRSGNKMMAVDIATQPGFTVGKPRMLFEGPYVPTGGTSPNYDVSPDGQHFLMLKPFEQADAAPTQIIVVQNWFEELKQNVPPRKEVMTLTAGTRLGSYEVVAPIGAGGMGEVYQAHDTKLGRDVAIKVLPEAFAHDPERLSRFQREAKMLAALNHSNIATIYGLEQSNGTSYLVMELVSGETLADRVKREGAVPIEEALTICKQIAEALEAAHEKGIIHRDLKPANVKVTPEGKVKVLDFGLAKAFSGDAANEDPSNSPTLSMAATMHGVILGTAAYMSPEQARGKAVDKRTDIWAFGCVLYELLTGKQAFEGEDITEILAAVVKSEPDWTALPANISPSIRILLQRCLQKDKALRLRDAGDAHLEIQEALTAPATAELTTAVRGIRAGWRGTLLWGGASLLLAAIIGLAAWNLKPTPPAQRPVTRTVITLPPGQQLAGLDSGPSVALSPDGTRLAYVATQGGTQQLYLRAMDSLESKSIPGTEGGVNPFFSPDGQWLGFFANGKLKKVSVSGGGVSTLSDSVAPRGASWGSQGTIAFGTSYIEYLQQVSDSGSAPQPLTRSEKGENAHGWPDFLPGGKAVLFSTGTSGIGFQNTEIAVQPAGAGERRNLAQGGTNPRYAPSGHLIYVQGGNLVAAPFDPQRLEVTGAAVPVVEGVLQSTINGNAQYSFSGTGSLVYVTGADQSRQVKLVWVSRNGAEQDLAAPAHNYAFPRLSPDGRRIAVSIVEQDTQLWQYDISRETLTRFTFEGTLNVNAAWTPDGKRIAFLSNKEGPGNIYWQMADGSGGLERLTTSEHVNVPTSWSQDGQLLAFIENNPTTGQDIWVLRLGDHKAQPFLRTPFNESVPRFSPDGRWLAYISNESGRFEIYAQPYPGPGGKWQISTDGGTEPVWNPNGRELFYRSGNKMMAVDIATQPGFVAGTPRMLFNGLFQPTPLTNSNYDVSPDGQRFLMLKPREQAEAAPTQIVVVQNWFEELKQKVPVGKK